MESLLNRDETLSTSSYSKESIDYSYRRSMLEKANLYRLTEEGLQVSSEQNSYLIPFTAIQQIQLYYFPNRYKTNNYACKITHSRGVLDLYSMSFQSFGSFTDQGKSYRSFVETFVQKAKSANPRIRVLVGNTTLKYGFNWVVIGFTIFIILLTIVMMPIIAGGFLLILRILFILYLFYYGFKHMGKNYPKELTEPQIPERVLPQNKI